MTVSQSWVREKTRAGILGPSLFASHKERLQGLIMKRKARQDRGVDNEVPSCCKQMVQDSRRVETPTQRLVAKN